jgi:hypothetical protein
MLMNDYSGVPFLVTLGSVDYISIKIKPQHSEDIGLVTKHEITIEMRLVRTPITASTWKGMF